MEKLTIEHLAGYPFNEIEFILSEKGIFNLDSEFGTPYQATQPMKITNIIFGKNTEVELNSKKLNWGIGFIELDEVMPILYPLSMLTKEIEVNGEKFVPIVKFINDCTDEDCIDFDESDMGSHEEFIISYLSDSDMLSLNDSRWLYKHHFAVNIPEHLYINKASII